MGNVLSVAQVFLAPPSIKFSAEVGFDHKGGAKLRQDGGAEITPKKNVLEPFAEKVGAEPHRLPGC